MEAHPKGGCSPCLYWPGEQPQRRHLPLQARAPPRWRGQAYGQGHGGGERD